MLTPKYNFGGDFLPNIKFLYYKRQLVSICHRKLTSREPRMQFIYSLIFVSIYNIMLCKVCFLLIPEAKLTSANGKNDVCTVRTLLNIGKYFIID